MFNPQLDRGGALAHLLTTEGLPRRLLEPLLARAARLLAQPAAAGPAAPAPGALALLADPPAPLLHDACARVAAQRGMALADPGAPALPRGRTLPDWLGGLPARGIGTLVLRDRASGAAHLAARLAPPGLRIVNGGDGPHADPVAALAALLSIQAAHGGFTELTVAFVGDLNHAPAARSLVHALTTLGAPQLRAVAPASLLPEGVAALGLHAWPDADSGVADADVIVPLPCVGAASGWALTPERLARARPGARVLPAPDAAACAAVLSALLASWQEGA